MYVIGIYICKDDIIPRTKTNKGYKWYNFTETKSLLLLVHADDTMFTTNTKDKKKNLSTCWNTKSPLINTVDVILKINTNYNIYPTIRTDDDKFYSRQQHSTNH